MTDVGRAVDEIVNLGGEDDRRVGMLRPDASTTCGDREVWPTLPQSVRQPFQAQTARVDGGAEVSGELLATPAPGSESIGVSL